MQRHNIQKQIIRKGENKMNEQTYYNAKDIAAMLGISMGKAYKILREMNQELSSKGFLAVYFKEKQITAPMIRKWQGEML